MLQQLIISKIDQMVRGNAQKLIFGSRPSHSVTKFITEVDMNVEQMTAFVTGWGFIQDGLCNTIPRGPSAAHVCNKWYYWKSIYMKTFFFTNLNFL